MSEAVGGAYEGSAVNVLRQMRLCLVGSIVVLLMTIGAGYVGVRSGNEGSGVVIQARRFEVVDDGGRVVGVIAAHGRSAQIRISSGEESATLILGEVDRAGDFGVHMWGPNATSEVQVVVRDRAAGIAVDCRALPPSQDAHHVSLTAGGGPLLMLTQFREGDKSPGLVTVTPNEVRVRNGNGDMLLEAPKR